MKQSFSIKALCFAMGSLGFSTESAQESMLETIFVTADRQESSTRDIPSSISVVDQDSLLMVSHVHINEALARVPGTWISRGNGQEHLTALRSPVFTGAGSCGAFQMSQDGIPLRAAGFCNVNQLFEANTEQAASVEVIRGPGSILYGANALHGAINVLSRPVSEELTGDISLEVGPFDYGRVKTSVSSTDGNQGVRVDFNGTSDGGYKDDSGFDQQKLNLIHSYDNGNYRVTSAFNFSNLNQETAGFIQGFEAYKDDNLKEVNPNPEAFRDATSYRLYSRVEWETSSLAWTVTPYLRKTDMDFLMHFLPGQPLEENGHDSIGLQTMVAGLEDGPLSWQAGIDFEWTQGYLKQTQDGVADGSAFLQETLPPGKQYDFVVDAELLSPYLQLDYAMSDMDTLNFGIRYEYLSYDYDNRMIDGRTRDDGTPCGFGGCRYSRPADRSDSFSNFSAQLGWIHDFSDANQVYASLARAFRAPQSNELYRLQNDQVVADLDSESLDSIEFGYRANYDRVSYSLSVFYMEKENVVFQDSNRNNVSDGETEHKGLEFSSSFALTDNLRLDLVASYARHIYGADISPRGVVVNIEGNDMDTAPRFTGSTQLNWQLSQRQNLELEWVHMDSYYVDEANLNEYEGHELVNLRYYNQFNDEWYFAARLTNLLDTDYAERADFAFGNYRYFVGQPRGLYVTIGNVF